MASNISLFSGIYFPDTGGPAKFAETFRDFGFSNGVDVKIFAYSGSADRDLTGRESHLHFVNSNQPVFRRYTQMIGLIFKEARSGSCLLFNGCFWEVALARHLIKFDYVAKVPGDIVWERARNTGFTDKPIDSFQCAPLSFKYRIMRYFFSYSLRKARLVIAPSNHLVELCKIWGVGEEKIVSIKNSVSVPKDLQLRLNDFDFDFVTVCRLVPWKNVDEIIIASTKLHASLLIIGDGPEYESLCRLSMRLGSNVTFLGEVPQSHVLPHLMKCSTFVLNSNFEATSYALLEAQAAGLIVIANEGTGSEEVISHGVTGFLCGTKSGMQLVDAMQLSLQDIGQTRNLRKSGRDSVMKNFSLESNYKQILELSLQC
jgi:glycosyltransferase involved in cell wall biosynthesis